MVLITSGGVSFIALTCVAFVSPTGEFVHPEGRYNILFTIAFPGPGIVPGTEWSLMEICRVNET